MQARMYARILLIPLFGNAPFGVATLKNYKKDADTVFL